MRLRRALGVAITTTVLLSVSSIAPASAVNDVTGFGSRETITYYDSPFNVSNEIGYTVHDLRPSADSTVYPIVGRLYEAEVTVDAVVGTVFPQFGQFRARTPSGREYPVLLTVSTVKDAFLDEGGERVREAVLRCLSRPS